MKLNRFLLNSQQPTLHSSRFVQHDEIGSSSTRSFQDRKLRDRQRQNVRGYQDAQVTYQFKTEARQRQGSSQPRVQPRQSSAKSGQMTARDQSATATSRIDIVKPLPSRDNTSTVPAPHTFREPPSRYHS